MATVTTNTAQPASLSDPDYEKELRKAYRQQGAGQSQQQSAAAGDGSNPNSFENKAYGNSSSQGGNRGGGGSRGGSMSDEDYINKMYDSNLESLKQTLASNYETDVSNLDAEKENAQRQSDEDLNRAYIEALKSSKNFEEVQNAYGLTSGAMGQAQLAQGNQLQADLTNLRGVQEQVLAEIERQRSILAKEYAAAIAKAQADNDFQRAQALYEAAKAEEERMLQLQMAAGELMASVGDYSILGKLYGLSGSQIAALQAAYAGAAGGGGGGSSSGSNYTPAPGTPKSTSDQAAEDFVNNMLGNLTSSAADPSRVISGTSALNDSQKEYAQTYLNAILKNGAMT